ncbi:GNAT family N-acetyltransferase [Paenibacillus sp. YPG26]|uniref:GNAT family N-acetyltransferase n=1 Tax=Paenibacillus sp. YPG26 TaxID=2878915 RepID=UPI00203F36DB|nr:GNAT family N-acetyltransferase [Paenibacillus sp. YPG26]USB33386.1 GNAT family N-acetyltransferase [Paenibacillus sp. YPG26]
MKPVLRTYDHTYYDIVCDFLIELSKENSKYINWNWARWEWMMYHPEFNNDLIDNIGLWFCNDELVGMATFDHYFGEACIAVKSGHIELEKEALEYALSTFSDENGLGIAINDADIHSIELLRNYGFVKKEGNIENILELNLEEISFDYTLPPEIIIKSLNPETDLHKHHRTLWKGFDNGGDADLPCDEITMNKQKRMLSAPHLNTYLHTVAENEEGEYVAYCGCWYNAKTDYAYVEPICTIPSYRGKGLGKAVLLEALKRCNDLGAKKTYVISDSAFYKALGFNQYSRYTFYWHQ